MRFVEKKDSHWSGILSFFEPKVLRSRGGAVSWEIRWQLVLREKIAVILLLATNRSR